MTKWGDRPHWEFAATHLGRDRHGDWLGIVAGTTMTRPGATYVALTDQVGLVPAPGDDDDRGWLATFHAVGGPVRVYVDVTTPPVWDGTVVRAVDLDLDVVRGNTGRVWVDDEDEFADHRIRFRYPDDLVAAAMASCDRVHAAVAGGAAPDHGAAERWVPRAEAMPLRLPVEPWSGAHRLPRTSRADAGRGVGAGARRPAHPRPAQRRHAPVRSGEAAAPGPGQAAQGDAPQHRGARQRRVPHRRCRDGGP